MTIMAHKVALKEQPWPRGPSHKEVIHSGHFMVSHFEAEAQDDEDELAVPVPEEEEVELTHVRTLFKISPSKDLSRRSLPQPQLLPIETSLSKLFQCMSLAYRQKLTSPKWNRFKGIRLRWKDKIRLNNVIWRCWHMQFINKQKTLVCQFASPLDVDTHNKPEAVVLEGKYWKRKLNAVTAEYKKWRMYYHHKILGCPTREGQDMLAEFESPDWQSHSNDNTMMVDEDYMGLMTDTLFTTIAANQPYAFPDSREIARGANLADFIQPSLVQLQPNLDEFMDFEPLQDLFYSSKLMSVPEEQGCLSGPQSLDLLPSYQGAKEPTEDPLHEAYEAYQQPSGCTWFIPPSQSTSNSSQEAPCIQSSSQISQLHHFKTPFNPPPPPPPLQQASIPTPPLPPPLPPQPLANSEIEAPGRPEVFAVPKVKPKGGRGRTKNSVSSKKNVLPCNNILPNLHEPNTLQHQQQPQPRSSALLAQLLTNNSTSTYAFIKNDQQVSPIHKVANLNSRPVEVPYLQSGYSNSPLIFSSQSDIVKSEPYSASEKGSGSSQPSPSVSPKLQSAVLVNSISSLPSSTSSSVCPPDSPGLSEQLSLSPLSVGSPASPSTKSTTGFKEHRRVYYNNAEQKRRCNIKNGFDTLHSLIPHLNQSPNAKMSKAVMLHKGAEYIQQLRNERTQLKQEMESLRQQIDALNSSISNCQSMLPATGAPVSRHRSNKMKEMFQHYVRSRTHEAWKFWILSLICEPLLESFNINVSNSSLDDLYHTTLQWVDQHCTLVELRPIVLNALRRLCATTEVLCDPSRLPKEARAAVEKQSKQSS